MRYLICHDRWERLGIDSSRIVSADETWEARFWPNTFIKWTSLKVNIGMVKSHHINGSIPTEFFSIIIEEALKFYGKDKNQFFLPSTTKEMIRKRKKDLGINIAPREEELVDEIAQQNSPTPNSSLNVTLNNAERNTFNINTVDPPIGDDGNIGTSAENIRHCDISEQNKDHDNNQPLQILDVLAPNMNVVENPGDGNCLCFSVAQHGGFDATKLRQCINKAIVNKWIFVKDFYTFPFSITIGTGNDSYEKVINHQYDLFSLLMNPVDGVKAFTYGEVEVQVLANTVNAVINVLMYNINGFPPGTSIEGRSRIARYTPTLKGVPSEEKIKIEDEIWLLYEDNTHYRLLVDKHISNEDEHDLDKMLELSTPLRTSSPILQRNMSVHESLTQGVGSSLRRSQRIASIQNTLYREGSFLFRKTKRTKIQNENTLRRTRRNDNDNVCACNTTSWQCNKCKLYTCDFCCYEDTAEEGSKRLCLQCGEENTKT